MANEEQVAMIKRSVNEWNKWRKDNPDVAIDLSNADFRGTELLQINLEKANLKYANLSMNNIMVANLYGADLSNADLSDADLRGATLDLTNLTDVNLNHANLEGATLSMADLSHAALREANLTNVNLTGSLLTQSNLAGANLSGAILTTAKLGGANLLRVTFNNLTQLNQVQISDRENGGASLRDIQWNGVDLTVVDWEILDRLGDEKGMSRLTIGDIKQIFSPNREKMLINPALPPLRVIPVRHTFDYRDVSRAYRQLATRLREQGLAEDGDRFAYRAQLMHRNDLFRRRFWKAGWIWSGFLNLLAGYGYRPAQTVIAYFLVIGVFALSYMHFGTINHHPFTFHESIIFSLTSFHGRGFFPGSLGLDDPITTIAALEAVIGLLIEVTFIATFTQRFFGK